MKKFLLVSACLLISTLGFCRQNWNESSRVAVVKVNKILIGHANSSGENYVFAADANTTEQVLTIASVVPAYARILDVQLINKEAAVFSGGATTLVAEIGTSSSGNEIAASATIYAINVLLQPATGTSPLVSVSATASSLYVSATPGRNWDEMTAGQWVLLVTYVDNNMNR
jgi:hypothetical protein